MKIYSIENGYEKSMFTSFEAANEKFMEIARSIIASYTTEHKNDMGYLDLNMWITIYDSETMAAESYLMPNLSNMRKNDTSEIGWLSYKGPASRKHS